VLEMITVEKLHILKKALDVLVAVSLMERAPLAHAFLRCGFAHKVGVLAGQYHYDVHYTQRCVAALLRSSIFLAPVPSQPAQTSPSLRNDAGANCWSSGPRHDASDIGCQAVGSEGARESTAHGCDLRALAADTISQGDGCILFELMAFGTTVPEVEHRANCL
jgi:hypothetical protein